MTTKYIAHDGKEFDDESECRKYEQSLPIKSVTFYDGLGNETPEISQCCYIKIDTDEALDSLRANFNNLDLDGLHWPGVYHYDTDYYTWILCEKTEGEVYYTGKMIAEGWTQQQLLWYKVVQAAADYVNEFGIIETADGGIDSYAIEEQTARPTPGYFY